MALPIKNGKITTAYKKPGKMWSKGYHTGVDFAVPVGTDVVAVADGKIENANWGKAYGTQLVQIVDGGWVIYAHLSKALVKAGDKVTKGNKFGMMKFGSRIDILLDPKSEIFVKPGDRTVAGVSIIGKIKK